MLFVYFIPSSITDKTFLGRTFTCFNRILPSSSSSVTWWQCNVSLSADQKWGVMMTCLTGRSRLTSEEDGSIPSKHVWHVRPKKLLVCYRRKYKLYHPHRHNELCWTNAICTQGWLAIVAIYTHVYLAS